MRQAIKYANIHHLPLIVAGDLTDTKANMRAEVVNAMIETFEKYSVEKDGEYIMPYILVGNHDKINEKSEEHSLNFLRPYATLIDSVRQINLGDGFAPYFIPYQHDVEDLKQYLGAIPYGSKVFMHQGIQGSNMGDYIQDKTAIPKEWCAGLRVISGHYHARQDIICPDGGLFSYVGNPYSLSFGEANDPEKGYQIIHANGDLKFVGTKLRSHRIIELSCGNERFPLQSMVASPQDLIWIKITGTKEELLKYDRQRVAKELGLTGSFKLDLIPLDGITTAPKNTSLNQNDLLDSMIDSMTNTTDERKSRLKGIWKDLL